MRSLLRGRKGEGLPQKAIEYISLLIVKWGDKGREGSHQNEN
jgi:hypothetical protein